MATYYGILSGGSNGTKKEEPQKTTSTSTSIPRTYSSSTPTPTVSNNNIGAGAVKNNVGAGAYTGNTGSSSSSKGGSGSTTTTPTVAPSNAGADYLSMMNGLLSQQRAAAESAYQNSMNRLGAAWDDTIGALQRNRENALNQLRSNYDYSSGQAKEDANKSLREAYINHMLNKKNMNQNLSAMGVSGGASESSLANMYNAYGNSRNNINTTLADNLASLLNTYQNNVLSAENLYNTQYADARNNYMAQMNALENALANNQVSNFSGGNLANLASYASTLGNLVQNMANAPWTPTENTLDQSSVSVQQGAGQSGDVTNYAKYKAMSDSLAQQGASASQIITELQRNGATANDIFSVFNV